MAPRITGLVIDVAANSVSKGYSDTLTVRVNYTYSGPAQTIQYEAYITQDVAVNHYDKIGGVRGSGTINQVASSSPAPFSANLSGIGFSGVEPGKTYGILLRFYGDLEGTGVRNWIEFGNRACISLTGAPVGIGFQVSIWGVPDFGSYQKWWAYYWDPGIGDFVSCGKWYSSFAKIPFSNVQPGGYLAVFLARNSTVSPQYTSPTFQAVSGGSYTYDVQMGVIYG